MKTLKFLLSLSLLFSTCLNAQDLPEFHLQRPDVEMPLNFLASDELQGRNTGTIYTDIAARFIAEQFRYFGVQPLGDDYFQEVSLVKNIPDKAATLKYGEAAFKVGENMILFEGEDFAGTLDVILAELGMPGSAEGGNPYRGLEVRNKLIFAVPDPEAGDASGVVDSSGLYLLTHARENGAVGVFLVWTQGKMEWLRIQNYSMNPSISLEGVGENEEEDPMIIGMILPDQESFLSSLREEKELKEAVFNFTNNSQKIPIKSQNVIGVVPGTDPSLKNEYVILTAHYDHVGTQNNLPAGDSTQVDTIFNGTRDDAMGTVALLSAARAFAEEPAKRSVIFAAFTAEEKGLLGSKYYVDHPLIPLNQTVFNLNADGTGYNDTTIVTIFGYNEVEGIDLLEKGSALFGIQIKDDPAPEQNLFRRSDNYSFAEKGIPAPTFSIGFNAFDEEIRKYYHQVTDNPNSISIGYLLRYSQAFTHSARLIADAGQAPFWKAGSKYEALGKKLFARKE